MRKFDIRSGVSISFVGILAIVVFFNQESAMGIIKQVLEQSYLKIFLNIVIVVIVLTHTIKVRSQEDATGFLVKSGFLPIDMFSTIGTYMAVSSTACSLLEGAFLQQFYEIGYFLKFSQLDIYILFGVSALLLWYVALHMYQLGVDLLFPLEKVQISTEEMHNKSGKTESSKAGAST
ncbi:hypothetical protein [Pectobacterium parmentieri]|uniref:hypothetical protein n=1 Tax=Pectobacterium parmentieri TaxID=1905730 RepID=UPI0018E14E2C|nr:hypothetical protein [Pectobacterium parmentieri]QQA74575.1 hypothetical protein JBL47_14345 [Pectobacterium parmentieri]